jgi:hypothetical protein
MLEWRHIKEKIGGLGYVRKYTLARLLGNVELLSTLTNPVVGPKPVTLKNIPVSAVAV